ncbi:MAG TPA: diguanylate cyclase [Solirubrobacterales bacterium]
MRRRFWLGIAAVTLVALGSVLAAILVYADDREDFDQMQHEEAVRAAHQAEAVAAVSVGKLATAAAFAQTQNRVDRHEFEVIGQTLIGGGALDGAAYIPRVPAPQRDDYERALGFAIHEQGQGLSMRPARPRLAYFPVTFGTSDVQAERLRGYDLGSDPLRAQALRRAADTGQAVATPVVPLLIGGTGINVFRPIYRDGASLQSRADRRRALTGLIAGSFRVDNVAAAALTVLPEDAELQLRIDGGLAYGSGEDLGDPASVPLRIADRNWVLAVEDPDGPGLSLPLALAVLGISLATLLGALILTWNRRERMRDLERQASQDALTGLDNRRRFERDLAAAMARSRRDRATGALLVLDIDDFKRVNDSQGHPAGDRLIKEVAGVLRRRTRRSDTLARLGGDEFAVILPRCSRAEAQIAAEAIAGEVREHRSDEETDPVTVSVGVAMFGDDPRTSAATVFSEADTAMYAAKDEGRDGVRVFDPVAVREDIS